ncbi:MAG: biotin/lipoyl-binding protein, partial [Proteobacteria bacterium]|nr:biotin/lipoyl-binding protein [Pseudomonadota bacterium]
INFYIDTSRISADRIPPSRGQQIDLSRGGESYRLEVYAIGSWRYRVHLEGQAVAASMREEGKHAARLRIDGRARRILYDAGDLGLRVEVDGHPYRFGWQSAGKVRAGTPAMVVAVHVRPGDRVEAGQALGLLEAMKTEIAFQAPVSGVVTEVCVQSGQQVAAGEVLLVIDSMGDPHGEGAETARLALPVARDPLALLFRPEAGDPLAVPDLAAADAAPPAARRDAIDTVREEIRRVLLGYDANPSRGERLVAFLEEPLPEGLSDEFQRQLAEIRFELATFADIGQLFIRAPRASVSGELGPSNNARFRMYVRRLHAAGSGIAEEFLDLVGRALSHYGASSLEPGDALERAVLRLLASQLEPELRSRLVLGVIRRVTALAGRGVDLSADATLAGALRQIAGMRGLVPHDLADAAIEARYVIFEQPRLDRDAEQTSSGVQSWMAAAEREPTPPPAGALVELAALPRRVFHRIGRWLGARDDRRTEIAVAAHVQRLYAPQVPTGHISHELEGSHIHCAEYPEFGTVLAAAAGADDLLAVAGRLCQAAERIRGGVHALELFLTDGAGDTRQTARRLERALAGRPLPARLTLSMAGGDGADEGEWVHCCFEAGGGARRLDCLDLHPEIADRIDLRRLEAFELERLPSEDGIYSFYGQSREVPGDERVFVLADVRGASPLAGREAAAHLPAFERSFYQATRSLRTILQRRDPRRRLQWNRLALFVSPEIYLDAATALDLSRRLAPLTRHLGLEKVIVRLKVLDRESPNEPARTVEIVIADPTGHRMELSWRAVHRDPLQPAQDYERRVVEARRRRLVYPYEIIRLLTAGEQALSDGESGADPLPPGGFEEYDLDPDSAEPRAIRVAGRPPGQNQAALVFGVISTPTAKVPEGMRRVLVLSDPTMGMGALAAPECDRLVAAIDLAESLGLPVEWLPVSSGARIAMDSGTENLDATARVVRRIVTFTQRGGVIHVVLQGVNVGAQTYFDALATMLMHTRGVLIMTPGASMVLTGRSALEASGAVSAEDEEAIGGFERVMGPNGQAQYYASSLPEAYAMLYDHYRYTYVVPGESSPRRLPSQDPPDRSVCDSEIPEDQAFGFATVGEIFDDETNPGRKHPFAMRTVMSALVDCDGGHLERWRPMVGAETAIVWDAHLGGFPVVLIGIESHALTREGYRPSDGPETWTGGTLFPLSSKKVARAINAASGNRPVVILANLSGFDGSPESLRKLQLEYGAEIATAVVNFQGPLLFLVVSRYHGGAYVVFSHELNDSLSASALEGSYASVIGGGPAAAVVFSREVRARTLADPRVQRGADESLLKEVTLEKQTELASEFDRIHTVERAQRVGSLEAIVPAARMRPFLIQSLEEALGSGR